MKNHALCLQFLGQPRNHTVFPIHPKIRTISAKNINNLQEQVQYKNQEIVTPFNDIINLLSLMQIIDVGGVSANRLCYDSLSRTKHLTGFIVMPVKYLTNT
jgi:tRNA A37 threonylcarbamoyltransferase TsaD